MVSVRAGTSAVNSQSTPPGSSDRAAQPADGAAGKQPRTVAEMSGPPPLERRPLRSPAPEGAPGSTAAGPRIATGLPPQPALGARRPAAGPASTLAGSLSAAAKPDAPTGSAGLSRSEAGKSEWAQPEKARSGLAKSAAGAGASPAERSDLPVPERARSAKLPADAETTGEASGRVEDAALAAVLEPKRITPRSPRVALEPDHVPLPSRSTRPSRRARNPLVIVGNAIFTLLVLVAIAGGGALVVGKSRFEAPGPLQEDKVVNIPPRSGMKEIADLLRREGVIDENDLIFIGGVLALGARSDLKAGEYVFPKQASVRDVLETIVEGKVVQHQITIPEGLTSEQIVARLLDNDLLTGSIKDVPREGSLLPDSYHVTRGFTREQMIQRMRQAQERLLREVWERRNPELPLKTPEQLVVLASIIEKETGKPEERTRVAAVFANRLKQRMKLQSDPTIIYGLVYGKGSLGRPISRADIQSQTPYNTYVIEGLPPGPIANPGRAAIEAAANPARTKELFFVADGTGGHAFAETYDQHQKNVARLRVMEQEQRGEPARGEAAPAEAPRAAPPAAARGKRGANGGARSAGAAQ
jgi:UPF0755 protein